jgi:hypothetical protein
MTTMKPDEIKQEINKAFTDALIFGHGIVLIHSNGNMQHIHPKECLNIFTKLDNHLKENLVEKQV